MQLEAVLDLLAGLERAGVRAWVGGGWGADALVGEQTRAHADLDLAVDADDASLAADVLQEAGLALTVDWGDVRRLYTAPDGRGVDVHPVRMAADGSGVQAGLDGTSYLYPAGSWSRGRLGGAAVPCLSAATQLSFRRGYPLRPEDLHDLVLLVRASAEPDVASDGAAAPLDLRAVPAARPDVQAFVAVRDGRGVAALLLALADAGDGRVALRVDPDVRRQGVATAALRALARHAFAELGLHRLELCAWPEDTAATRTAVLAGFHRDGVLRGVRRVGGTRGDLSVYSRLPTDPAPEEDTLPAHASTLPGKRMAGGLLVRDACGRALLVQPTYKPGWDLPGGSVEADESPQATAAREVVEELGVRLEVGRLLVLDWLAPHGARTEAVMLVFDGGVLDEASASAIRLPADELRSWAWCSRDELGTRLRPGMARRVAAALDAAETGTTTYLENGRAGDGDEAVGDEADGDVKVGDEEVGDMEGRA